MGTDLEKELELIRRRLDSIEEALSEALAEDDRRAFAEAVQEHEEGKSIPFVVRPPRRVEALSAEKRE